MIRTPLHDAASFPLFGSTPFNRRDRALVVTHPSKALANGLAQGQRVDEQDALGNTPLHIALGSWTSIHDNEPAVRMLLSAGADVHVRNMNGETALHVAVRKGPKDAVELLLRAGADVDATDEAGNTALCHARTVCVARALLQAGANPFHRNRFGITALGLAEDAHAWDVAELIEQAQEGVVHEKWRVLRKTPAGVRHLMDKGKVIPPKAIG